mmetsp:Transcript_22604/g.24709  ORF Transcript_22604/g.24709 Transcript_22604/m.24709 type:complete len:232 (+) Transcript_22604:29-724(+)|eukprot:gene4560-4889_t
MSKEETNEDDDDVTVYQFKIILLGDGAVGKTSIATRFTEDKFSQNYKQTIGVDFFIKRINLQSNIQIALQIWDIGGQSIGSKMLTSYISGADAVLLCYDITNYESFANLEDWYRLVIKAFENRPLPYLALCGNKYDLRHLTAVRSTQHSKFADENGMAAFLLSAKNGDQVKHAFWKISASLAGIPIVKFEQEGHAVVVPATILDYKRHDEAVHGGTVPKYNNHRNNNCILS